MYVNAMLLGTQDDLLGDNASSLGDDAWCGISLGVGQGNGTFQRIGFAASPLLASVVIASTPIEVRVSPASSS